MTTPDAAADPAAPTTSSLAVVVVASAFVAIAGLVLVSLLRVVAVPMLTGSDLPPGLTPLSALGLVVASLLVLLAFGASLYRRLYTKLGPEGLSFPAWGGVRHVPWSAIQNVSGRGMHIKLHTAQTTVIVNPLCYSSPRQVIAFLHAKLPRGMHGGAGRSG